MVIATTKKAVHHNEGVWKNKKVRNSSTEKESNHSIKAKGAVVRLKKSKFKCGVCIRSNYCQKDCRFKNYDWGIQKS